MPNDSTPIQPVAPASAIEATNARMLNQTVGKLIEATGASNADVVTALNAIASAVTASLIGGSTGATANRLLVSKGTAGRALQPTQVSLDPAAAGFAAAAIAFTATQRVLGRNSSGAGAGEEVTLTQVLDWISASVARGDILRRGASAWERLGIGSNGQVLTSNGTDPAWATPASVPTGLTTIASGSLTGSSVAITGIPETYAYLVLQLTGVSFDTNSRAILVRVSTNNGSSYDTTAANYPGDYWIVGGIGSYGNTTTASLVEGASLSAASTFNSTITIFNYQTGPHKLAEFYYSGSGGNDHRGRVWYVGATDNIDALQMAPSAAANFDAGTYALYGAA